MVAVEWAGDIKRIQERAIEYADMAFILLGKVTLNDFEERKQVMELAYETGREITAWMQEFFNLNSRLVLLQDMSIDAVGPLTNDNLYGWRFDWTVRIHKAFSFNTDNFGGNAPEKVI